MKNLLRTSFLVPLIALGACAQATHGTTQSIRVTATPVTQDSVTCTAENERGAYTLPIVPAHLQVQRARGPLVVRCQNSAGWRGATTVESYSDVPALLGNPAAGTAVGVTAANAVIWGSAMSAGPATALGVGVGSVGLGQDLRSGAGWGYPSQIVVELQPPSSERLPVSSAQGAPLTPVAAPVLERRPRHTRPARPARTAPSGDPSK